MDNDAFEYVAVPQPLPFPPAEMMLDLAKGLEEPEDIAERYGYDIVQYNQLVEWAPFRQEYDRMVSKLESEGTTFRNKAVLYATDLLDRLYVLAKRPDATLPQLLETAKYMTKAADLEPKQAQTSQSGATYSVNIVLKDLDQLREERALRSRQTVDGEVVLPQITVKSAEEVDDCA